jgi:hypothetical protein
MPCMLSYPHRLKSGQITCYLNRTYHVLTTTRQISIDKRALFGYGQPTHKSSVPKANKAHTRCGLP